MKPICIIPARGGSKGIAKKNIRIINKKPLIEYTITSCLKSKLFSHVYVSTEDNIIDSSFNDYEENNLIDLIKNKLNKIINFIKLK